MALPKKSSQDAWRRTGFVNIALASTCGISLLVCLIISLKRPGSSLNTSTIIFEGSCNDSSNINIALHLVLNLLSTGILASSNYFMQIVSSPSRDEIDKAHMFLFSLDIGIPSNKNIQFISRFKKTCWVVLLLSSLPIHLFFNGTIFETRYQGSDWYSTVATEAFTRGEHYFPPGASLEFIMPPRYNRQPDIKPDEIVSPEALQEIKKAATDGSSWKPMDPPTCYAEYTTCKPRNQYRDVVMVVDSGTNNTKGWTRGEAFKFPLNTSLWWDKYVPRNETNSLWHTSQCALIEQAEPEDRSCHTRCDYSIIPPLTQFNLYNVNKTSPSHWTVFPSYQERDPAYRVNDKLIFMTIKYCLAEPYSRVCKVGISNALLLLVIICTFIKSVQCGIIVWKLPHYSLVTPGDAIASFITNPDPYTIGLGTLDILDSSRLESKQRQFWSPYDEHMLVPTTKPRQWVAVKRRYLSIIPRTVRFRTYVLLIFSIIILCVGLGFSYQSNDHTFGGPFGHSDEVRVTNIMRDSGFMSTLIVANTPQLLLSACYFSYNAFFTRLLVEQEWNSYSLRYQPLRVSYPKGGQISSYRLQLPYKYSIPLIIISVVCHWLLSDAFFFFGIEGGTYLLTYGVNPNPSTQAYFHLSETSLVSLGYSTPAILALLVIGCAIVPLPLLFSLRRPKGKMVAGGSNSLVMSAACHCFISSPTEVQSQACSPSNDEEEMLRELSQSKLKWGATSLPSDVAEAMSEESGNMVMHLGFGGESSKVRCPEEGEWYV
ncbi:hypothetical protein F5Y00DRAFT_269901 [Daldinia vernicosa]|uniref:uncharacterized protein n=1 Tax=Daldinia vernicosa TaxID=114800 RepID=UPI002007EF7B|nr:uncharacterized protein F5Y00DRAFT_269901 [Daldinia vernicosa]KAI0848973.1 hypothetical protein F5Y00DRAFT_269901 [Daldinia vernicosa]